MADNGKLLERVTARPDVFGGKPIVRDMRITVELILRTRDSCSVTAKALLG